MSNYRRKSKSYAMPEAMIRPPVVLAKLHSEHRTHHCKNCQKHLRDCCCGKPEPYEMEDFGFKGKQTLDPTHPDSPDNPNRHST